MPAQLLGSVIGGVFGLVFVLANTGSLPPAATLALRVLGVLAFAAVLVGTYRAWRTRTNESPGHGRSPFGPSYWLVVAAEVVALLVGVRVVDVLLGTSHAGVAWVSFVVGVHFFALAVVFRDSFFHRLGAAITVCGVVGLVLAVTGTAEAPIAVVSGVTPGALLLAAGWWGTRRTPIEGVSLSHSPAAAGQDSDETGTPARRSHAGPAN